MDPALIDADFYHLQQQQAGEEGEDGISSRKNQEFFLGEKREQHHDEEAANTLFSFSAATSPQQDVLQQRPLLRHQRDKPPHPQLSSPFSSPTPQSPPSSSFFSSSGSASSSSSSSCSQKQQEPPPEKQQQQQQQGGGQQQRRVDEDLLLRGEVLQQLRKVVDPDLKKNIVALGFVKNLLIDKKPNGKGVVAFELRLTTPACPVKEDFVTLCKELLLQLPWVSEVKISVGFLQSDVSAASDLGLHGGRNGGLSSVAYVVAVSSCKGGVGKSTAAVNLAFLLKHMGASVGLLDADLYGPSLPLLLPLEQPFVYGTTAEEARQQQRHELQQQHKLQQPHKHHRLQQQQHQRSRRQQQRASGAEVWGGGDAGWRSWSVRTPRERAEADVLPAEDREAAATASEASAVDASSEITSVLLQSIPRSSASPRYGKDSSSSNSSSESASTSSSSNIRGGRRKGSSGERGRGLFRSRRRLGTGSPYRLFFENLPAEGAPAEEERSGAAGRGAAAAGYEHERGGCGSSATGASSEDVLLTPLEYRGVKLMSYGFVRKAANQGFSALRGPFASRVVEQLLTGTFWGSLDYLIIDFPPGTGDIHISLAQAASIDACVVVTTPQALSWKDAERGIRMFHEVGIPAICVVENMAFFECDNCHKQHFVFNRNPPFKTSGGSSSSTTSNRCTSSASSSSGARSGSSGGRSRNYGSGSRSDGAAGRARRRTRRQSSSSNSNSSSEYLAALAHSHNVVKIPLEPALAELAVLPETEEDEEKEEEEATKGEAGAEEGETHAWPKSVGKRVMHAEWLQEEELHAQALRAQERRAAEAAAAEKEKIVDERVGERGVEAKQAEEAASVREDHTAEAERMEKNEAPASAGNISAAAARPVEGRSSADKEEETQAAEGREATDPRGGEEGGREEKRVASRSVAAGQHENMAEAAAAAMTTATAAGGRGGRGGEEVVAARRDANAASAAEARAADRKGAREASTGGGAAAAATEAKSWQPQQLDAEKEEDDAERVYPYVERIVKQRRQKGDKVYGAFRMLGEIVVRELSVLRFGRSSPSVVVRGDGYAEIAVPTKTSKLSYSRPFLTSSSSPLPPPSYSSPWSSSMTSLSPSSSSYYSSSSSSSSTSSSSAPPPHHPLPGDKICSPTSSSSTSSSSASSASSSSSSSASSGIFSAASFVHLSSNEGSVRASEGLDVFQISLERLRLACQCNLCTSPGFCHAFDREAARESGAFILQDVLRSAVNSLLFLWRDGHRTVLPLHALERLAGSEMLSEDFARGGTPPSCFAAAADLECQIGGFLIDEDTASLHHKKGGEP